ncbi:sigma-70 family RNA polymerase sigma factor [Ectobacillus funiculus]|uniref:sigma-70 family RNA polymerase sigma factor n=1 Tax=Ectobacillus funiculus TaxID=137993 RepID=UPI00397A1E61
MKDQNEYDQLIQLTLSGRKEAYGELYERTIQDVYKTVHFLIEERTDVDDLVQDIYIQAYQSLNQFDRSKPFRPWLMGIVVRQVYNYRRKTWTRFRILKKAEKHKRVIELDFSNDVVDKISNHELILLIDNLPYKLKQVIILRYLNEYSQEEVASILDIPLGTVKSRINAALKKLRQKGQANNIFLGRAENIQ